MDKNIVYLGDCLEVMKTFENKSVDVCFTSPPYNDKGRKIDFDENGILMNGQKNTHTKYKHLDFRKDWFEWQCEVIDEMLRVSKRYVLYNVQGLINNRKDVYKIIGKYSNRIHDIVIWHKRNGCPTGTPHKMSNCDEFSLIDIEDIPKIKDYCWNYQKRSYYPSAKINGKRKYLHRIIMPNNDKRFVTDHINRNPLDNRKSNLRIVTQCVNCQNEDKRTTNTTGYKNISYISTRDIYVVAFRANHKNYYVGSYRDLETAVQKLEEYKKEHNL